MNEILKKEEKKKIDVKINCDLIQKYKKFNKNEKKYFLSCKIIKKIINFLKS